MRDYERMKRKAADVRKKETSQMAKNRPDEKAVSDFKRPPYQSAVLIREQGEQMEHKSVEQYLAEKNDIKTGVGTSGEDRREQREE